MTLRVGWHLAIQVFASRITRESRLKPLGPDLIGECISPCLVLWRCTVVPSLRPLVNSGTTSTSKSL
jgi:hypothetical protein